MQKGREVLLLLKEQLSLMYYESAKSQVDYISRNLEG